MATTTARTAGAGFFPLDEQLELWERHWSEQVAKQAVWLSGLVSFEQAAEIMNRIGRVPISDSSVWRRVEKWGEEFKAIEAAERELANVLPGKRDSQSRSVEQAGRKGVSMDGSMMHIREEGWKEFKVGCVFDVEARPTRDAETGDMVELAHAVNNSYTAHLGGPELFGQMVWAEAKRRGWEQAADTEVVGDAAPWIWNLAIDYFYDSLQAVDWCHATEHLATAARLLKGEGTLAATRWFNAQKEILFQGHADRIAQTLTQAAQAHPAVAEEVEREAGYFRRNQRRMNYQELREEGWLIGSGMVESGGKQFKGRFTGPGMRWSRPGAEKLLPVRAAIMSSRFDSLWQRAYNSPPN